MKKLSVILLACFLSSCALIRAQEMKDKEEEIYVTKLICDSNKNYIMIERKYCKAKGDKRDQLKEELEEEKDYLQRMVAFYQNKYEKKFNWKRCKK